ncbi:hypothetical protein [Streptomyces sp. NPDC097619]|uniref:hypothetical protein n=1 Tax=Streptomyces sp. NPDC097619 TaxID=3157228 RepID=UPI00331BE565
MRTPYRTAALAAALAVAAVLPVASASSAAEGTGTDTYCPAGDPASLVGSVATPVDHGIRVWNFTGREVGISGNLRAHGQTDMTTGDFDPNRLTLVTQDTPRHGEPTIITRAYCG